VTLAGAVEESTIVLRRGLAALGTQGDATVIGARERLAPPHAALANGAAAHAIEMDDTHSVARSTWVRASSRPRSPQRSSCRRAG
jgi:2-methylcitrate dehydratase PrpD